MKTDKEVAIEEKEPTTIENDHEMQDQLLPIPQKIEKGNNDLKKTVIIPDKESFPLLDLSLELQFHVFSFLSIRQVVIFDQISNELQTNAKRYLNLFSNLLRIFFSLSTKSQPLLKPAEFKKKQDCLAQLIEHPQLSNYLADGDQCEFFFNHLLANCGGLGKDKFKILLNLYFCYANDEILTKYINVYHRDSYPSCYFLECLEKSHFSRFEKLKLHTEFFKMLIGEQLPQTGTQTICPFPLLAILISLDHEDPDNEKMLNEILQKEKNPEWEEIRQYILASKILKELKASNDPKLDVWLMQTHELDHFFNILFSNIHVIELDKQRILMLTVFNVNRSRCPGIIHLLKTNNNPLISNFLKEFLAINHTKNSSQMGFSSVVEHIVFKEQAVELIMAIQTLPIELQNLHYSELHNRILLLKKSRSDLIYHIDYFNQDFPHQDLFQQWEDAFKVCKLDLNDYKRFEGSEFRLGCVAYHKKMGHVKGFDVSQ